MTHNELLKLAQDAAAPDGDELVYALTTQLLASEKALRAALLYHTACDWSCRNQFEWHELTGRNKSQINLVHFLQETLTPFGFDETPHPGNPVTSAAGDPPAAPSPK